MAATKTGISSNGNCAQIGEWAKPCKQMRLFAVGVSERAIHTRHFCLAKLSRKTIATNRIYVYAEFDARPGA